MNVFICIRRHSQKKWHPTIRLFYASIFEFIFSYPSAQHCHKVVLLFQKRTNSIEIKKNLAGALFIIQFNVSFVDCVDACLISRSDEFIRKIITSLISVRFYCLASYSPITINFRFYSPVHWHPPQCTRCVALKPLVKLNFPFNKNEPNINSRCEHINWFRQHTFHTNFFVSSYEPKCVMLFG